MVTRLYGSCNGAEIVCTPSDAGRWTATVPAVEDGKYVIELYAEDEAGNVSYFATVEMTYDSRNLRVSFRVLQVASDVSLRDVQSALRGEGILCKWRT